MTTSTLDVLKATRELIALPERWTQRALARDEYKAPVGIFSSRAVCFCLEGALIRSEGDNDDADAFYGAENAIKGAKKAIYKVIGSGSISLFNDAPGRTHSEVLAVLDEAIEEWIKGQKP